MVALVTLAIGFAMLIPVAANGRWIERVGFGGLVARRVVGSFRSKEVLWRSVGTVVALVYVFACLGKLFPETADLWFTSATPLLVLGALYYLAMSAIVMWWHLHHHQPEQPPGAT